MNTLTLDRWTSKSGNEYQNILVEYSAYHRGEPHRRDRMGGTISAPEGAVIEGVSIITCDSGWAQLLHELKEEHNRDSFEESCIEQIESQNGGWCD